MPAKEVASQEIRVGEEVVIEGLSPSPPYQAVFEDDGDTGYFYALDTSRDDNPILDALHIYEVEGVTDKHLPSKIQIVWSMDDQKAALLINDYPHAIFDFAAKRGYCRNDFPPSDSEEWSQDGHAWDDKALRFFE